METAHNINSTFGPETANEHIVKQWFKKFCKDDEPLEDEESSGRPLEVDQQPDERIIQAGPFTTTWEVARELSVDYSLIVWHLKQIGKVKKLGKWVPHELTANQKNCLEVSSSLLLHSNELFLDQIVTCNENWIVYESWWQPAQQLDWEEALKSFPKPNLHQEKGHGHCLVVCCCSDFLQLSESQQNRYIWEVCWASCWDAPKTVVPAASIGQQKGPSSSLWRCPVTWCTTSASKVEQTGLLNFASSILYSPDLLTANWLPLLWASWQLFCRENASTTSRMQKMLSKSWLNPEALIFFAAGINVFLVGKSMLIIITFLFWLIKMCLSLVILIENSGSKTTITIASI